MAIQSAKAQIQAVPYVDMALCQACRKCLARAVCKSKALIQLDPEEPPFVDASRCYGCDLCIPACPFGALRLNQDYRVLHEPFVPLDGIAKLEEPFHRMIR